MQIITATEFKNHFGKYNEMAKTEEIIVTSFGKEMYKLVPIKQKKMEIARSLIGILPVEATIGEDLDERAK